MPKCCNYRNVPTRNSRVCTRSSIRCCTPLMPHAPFDKCSSHVPRSRRQSSVHLIHPARASSPLTIFPKRDSHHPTRPYPSIPCAGTPSPHAHEPVATLARMPSQPLCPHTHAHATIHLSPRTKSRKFIVAPRSLVHPSQHISYVVAPRSLLHPS